MIACSVSGVIIRRSEEFSKLVKLIPSDLHTEIIIRSNTLVCVYINTMKTTFLFRFRILTSFFQITEVIIVPDWSKFKDLTNQFPAELFVLLVFHILFVFRRFPFSQIYLLKPEIEGQSLGILNYNNTPEIREIVPGSVAAAAGN